MEASGESAFVSDWLNRPQLKLLRRRADSRRYVRAAESHRLAELRCATEAAASAEGAAASG